MGVCISYKGSLSDPSRLGEAIAEIRSFCERVGWPCEDGSEHLSGVILVGQAKVDRDPGTEEPNPEPWPEMAREQERVGLQARVSRLRPPPLIEETLRGVIVCPPDTDGLRLVFDHTGRLVSYMKMPSASIIDAIPDTKHYLAFPHFCKTSGAPATHAAICVLLRMLQQKFMTNLEVTDDTGFWETWDLEKLGREHVVMDALLGIFREAEDIGALLTSLGVDIPPGAKITRLNPRVEGQSTRRKAKPGALN